ncbi:MAG: phosphoribosylformylglycinamidine synthase subunit PurS [Methanobacteriota archaeon]
MYNAEVRVALKPGVTDPEGASTKKALSLLGFRGVSGVRMVKVFEVEVDAPDEARAKTEVEEMCRRLLANPVIHDYSIHVQRV